MENFERLGRLLKQIGVPTLRSAFKEKWRLTQGHTWEDSNSDRATLLNIFSTSRMSLLMAARKILENDFLNKWDLMLLIKSVKVLTLFDNSMEPGRGSEELGHLDNLLEVRNQLSHSSDEPLSAEDFEELWEQATIPLKFYGVFDAELDRMKHDFNLASTNEARGILEQGKVLIASGKFQEAIHKLTEGTLLARVDAPVLCQIHIQMSIASMNLPHPNYDEALKYAQMADEEPGTCYASKKQLGQVYLELDQLEKALECFDVGLVLNPTNSDLMDLRIVSRVKMEINQSEMQPRGFHRTLEDILTSNDEPLTDENIRKCKDQVLSKEGNMKLILEGHMYREGIGFSEDITSSIKCYREAAEAGSAEGYLNVAFIGLHSAKSLKSLKNSMELMKIAASCSCKDGPARSYGVAESAYFHGLFEEVRENYEEAFAAYTFASEKNSTDAAYRAGAIKYFGKGSPPDKEAGIELWKRAATGEPRNAKALERLSWHYLEVEHDFAQALRWFDELANSDNGNVEPRIQAEFQREMTAFQALKAIIDQGERQSNNTQDTLKALLHSAMHRVSNKHFSHLNCIEETRDHMTCISTPDSEKEGENDDSFYDPEEILRLERHAAAGNQLAQRLLSTKHHFSVAMNCLKNEVQLPKDSKWDIITHMAMAIRLEYYYFAQYSELTARLNDVYRFGMNSLRIGVDAEKQSDQNLCIDMRVCWSFKIMPNTREIDTTLAFLEQSIKLYPSSEVYFYELCSTGYEIKKDYKNVVRTCNRGLEMFPNHPGLLFQKAFGQDNLSSLGRDTKIAGLLKFTKFALEGDSKLAQVYYQIFCLWKKNSKRDWKEAKANYDKAKKAEKSSLTKPLDTGFRAEADAICASRKFERWMGIQGVNN